MILTFQRAAFIFLSALFFVFSSGPLFAQNQELLHQIERTLDTLHTGQGRFMQIDGAGNVDRGSVYISRPGRIRFQYDSIPVIIVSNGDIVAQVDTELEQVDFRLLRNTPLSILLDDKVRFRPPYQITHVEHTSQSIMVSMLDSNKPNDGTITIIFHPQTLELLAWTIVDKQGRTTTVRLEQMSYGMPLSPALFIVPEFERESLR